MRCPKCKSDNVQRSHRRGLKERLVSGLFSSVMYRCRDCSHRFSRERRQRPVAKKKHARRNAYLLIAALVLSALVAMTIVEYSNGPVRGGNSDAER